MSYCIKFLVEHKYNPILAADVHFREESSFSITAAHSIWYEFQWKFNAFREKGPSLVTCHLSPVEIEERKNN